MHPSSRSPPSLCTTPQGGHMRSMLSILWSCWPSCGSDLHLHCLCPSQAGHSVGRERLESLIMCRCPSQRCCHAAFIWSLTRIPHNMALGAVSSTRLPLLAASVPVVRPFACLPAPVWMKAQALWKVPLTIGDDTRWREFVLLLWGSVFFVVVLRVLVCYYGASMFLLFPPNRGGSSPCVLVFFWVWGASSSSLDPRRDFFPPRVVYFS